MDETVGVSEFKSKCIAILKEVQRTGVALTITHRGRPLARIEPICDEGKSRRLGALREVTEIHGDIVDFDWSGDWDEDANLPL